MHAHVVVHYIVIKCTSCDTVVFDYIQFSKFHTHIGDDTLPRSQNYIRYLVFGYKCSRNTLQKWSGCIQLRISSNDTLL